MIWRLANALHWLFGYLLVAGRVALFTLISSVALVLVDVRLVNLLNTWLLRNNGTFVNELVGQFTSWLIGQLKLEDRKLLADE